jgi:P-type Cu+ transporter
MLGLASAVEANSEQPIAKAIASGAGRRGVKPESPVDFEALPGPRTRATVNGQSVAGDRDYLPT